MQTFFTHRISVRRGVLAMVIGVLLTSFATVGATASASPEVANAPAGAAEQHCVHNIDHDTLTCFATFTEAIAKATGGKITNAPADPAAATADLDNQINALAAEPGVQSHVVLSIVYSGTHHTGNSLIYEGNRECSSGGSVKRAISGYWNDEITSFRSYSDCRVTLYEHAYCGGASRTWNRNENPVGTGALNNRASSIRWSYNLPSQSRCYP